MKPCLLSDNRLADGTLTATRSAQGAAIASVLDRRPYTQWAGDGLGVFDIVAELPQAASADTIGIAGHNLADALVEVATSNDGITWTTVLEPFIPGTNLATARAFGRKVGPARVGKTASGKWWRVRVTAFSAPPEIGVLMVGSRLELPRFPKGSFAPESETAEIDNAESKGGLPLGSSIRYRPVNINANIPYPGEAWTRQIFKPFYDANLGLPLFFAWDLDDWPEMTILGKLDPKYSPTYDVLSRVENLPISIKGLRA